MEIEIIMQFVRMIVDCLEERRREDVEEGLRNPGRREYREIVRMLRADGCSGRELRQEASATFVLLQEADAEDIDLLLIDAEKLASDLADDGARKTVGREGPL